MVSARRFTIRGSKGAGLSRPAKRESHSTSSVDGVFRGRREAMLAPGGPADAADFLGRSLHWPERPGTTAQRRVVPGFARFRSRAGELQRFRLAVRLGRGPAPPPWQWPPDRTARARLEPW